MRPPKRLCRRRKNSCTGAPRSPTVGREKRSTRALAKSSSISSRRCVASSRQRVLTGSEEASSSRASPPAIGARRTSPAEGSSSSRGSTIRTPITSCTFESRESSSTHASLSPSRRQRKSLTRKRTLRPRIARLAWHNIECISEPSPPAGAERTSLTRRSA